MKEKEKIDTPKHNRPSLQDMGSNDPAESDQAVVGDHKEKIRKLCMKKFPNGPVFKKVDIEEKDERPSNDKGSHSLSELHFFQNHQR